jgi:hypothetical protein
MHKCQTCGVHLNPVAVMLGPVCGQCCRENNRLACGTLTAASVDRARVLRRAHANNVRAAAERAADKAGVIG